MFIIVGLGNPGNEYVSTRHNVGFLVIDYLSEHLRADFKFNNRFNAFITQSNINNTNISLIKPTTYMNLSGAPVQSVASFYKVQPSNIIVIHDDIDIALGEVRYKIGGGSAGHNGIKSIDRHIGINYHRIRIGVGKPEDPRYDISNFVLGKFSNSEMLIIEKTAKIIVDNLHFIISNDIEKFKQIIGLLQGGNFLN